MLQGAAVVAEHALLAVGRKGRMVTTGGGHNDHCRRPTSGGGSVRGPSDSAEC
ncbi:hypothetical protein BDZ97DRAFT_1780867 [Flammula alnicola]|nr:hypothetical protein BDZ97DRAFT_1780867 [Flammula alnicola]